ncbi:hypothetical protein PGT21_005171 [Puccinia graminis f. sp. tritici]|uniref:Uncharacterized protein n=1 Tax=Puccinia graminis f. sp. tritici TaxID=56615 RepID=A0A5B0RC44_PUCGR|nr:hypothetical protein PGT21_005171 [Puccinia graminis f. sp. tritici]KAA1123306.1 hypothetical protein PGTUg99_001154 [Puccinia graminis f. sp. tritici]
MKKYLMVFKSIGFLSFLFQEIQCMSLPDDVTSNVVYKGIESPVLGSISPISEDDAQRCLANIPQFKNQVKILPTITQVDHFSKEDTFVPLMGTLCTHLQASLQELASKYPTEGGKLLDLFVKMDSFQKLISDWKIEDEVNHAPTTKNSFSSRIRQNLGKACTSKKLGKIYLGMGWELGKIYTCRNS